MDQKDIIIKAMQEMLKEALKHIKELEVDANCYLGDEFHDRMERAISIELV